MMAICPQAESTGMVASVLDTVDCHIRLIVHDSYREVVGSNAWLAVALAAMLAIHFAFFGYRLMNRRDGVRLMDLPIGALKIGLIFALLTVWDTYQASVFDFLFDGPSEIVATLVGPLANSSPAGNVLGGVQTAFADMTAAAGVYDGMAGPTENVLQGGPMLASGVLWLAALLMLLITLGLVIAAKIALALLLVFGPIFVGLFLFGATRDLFYPWLRTTITFALAPLAANVLGAAMLLILAPLLGSLVKNVGRQAFDLGQVMTISLIVVAFALVIALSLRAIALIGGSWAGSAKGWEDLVPERLIIREGTRSKA